MLYKYFIIFFERVFVNVELVFFLYVRLDGLYREIVRKIELIVVEKYVI